MGQPGKAQAPLHLTKADSSDNSERSAVARQGEGQNTDKNIRTRSGRSRHLPVTVERGTVTGSLRRAGAVPDSILDWLPNLLGSVIIAVSALVIAQTLATRALVRNILVTFVEKSAHAFMIHILREMRLAHVP